VNEFKHIFVVGTARTGTTWLGKLLDTCRNVKYLWEPDHVHLRRNDVITKWNLDDPVEFRRRIMGFEPHVPILPEFNKGEIDTVVSKLITVLGAVRTDGHGDRDPWAVSFFKSFREKLDAKVLHIVRHPVRWAASVMRWGARPLDKMFGVLDYYTKVNMAFWERYKDEPWYRIMIHDRLTIDTEKELDGIMEFCGLEGGKQLEQFLQKTHSRDSTVSPHMHATVMRKATVLNRWRDQKLNIRIVRYANQLANDRWAPHFSALPAELWEENDAVR